MFADLINNEIFIFSTNLLAVLLFLFLSINLFRLSKFKENYGAFWLGLVCLGTSLYSLYLTLMSLLRLIGVN